MHIREYSADRSNNIGEKVGVGENTNIAIALHLKLWYYWIEKTTYIDIALILF